MLPVLAAILACAAYVNALDNPFVYDDHDTVVGNASLVDVRNVKFVLIHSPFRPVVNVSYAIDRWLWGYRPFGYHLTNITLHAMAVLLLFAWLRRVLSDAGAARATDAAAFVGATLFAVHPLQSEAVAYVSGRSELMCAVWFLAALLLARDALVSGSRARGAAAMACGLLSIASKEIGLVLPLVVLAYDWLFRPGEDAARHRRLWRVFVPLFVFLAAIGGYRLATMAGLSGSAATAPLLNLLTQAIVIWRYVGLLVWPSGQSVMHGVHRVTTLTDGLGWVALAGLAAAAIAAVRLRKSRPLATLGIFWFFAVLAPSSSVIPLREGMAEHRLYLASAGIVMAIAAVVSRWLTREPQPPRIVGRAQTGALCAIVAVLFTLTVWRNQVWADPVALWREATVHAAGMWEPHYALADSLREKSDCAGALPE